MVSEVRRRRTAVSLLTTAPLLLAVGLAACGTPHRSSTSPAVDAGTAAEVAAAGPAGPAPLPVTVTNTTGRTGPVYVYILGTDLASGHLGYVNAKGVFVPWTLPASTTPSPAPDAALTGPVTGKSGSYAVPKGLSGRIYFSFGSKLTLKLTRGGLVQPAPWNPSDPNAKTLLDWSELTYDAGGLWLNSTQVDQFAVPQQVSVTESGGRRLTTGTLRAGGRAQVVKALEANPALKRSVVHAADGSVLRVLSPGKASGAGLISATYLDPAVTAAWSAYSTSHPLKVVPDAQQPAKVYTGVAKGGSLVFTDSTGRQVASFAKPSSADVWDCAGALLAPNDQVVGPIARTLCAGLHRGTLGRSTTEPVTTPTSYYKASLDDTYAQVVHAAMADGKAYAFAFDDVVNQESLVHSATPVSAAVVLQPLG